MYTTSLVGIDYIGGIMSSIVVLSAIDRMFEHQSAQTNDYKIIICCFSVKQAALRSKSKDRLV